MGLTEFVSGDMIHTRGEKVETLEILLKGTVNAVCGNGVVTLRTGAIIGSFENPEYLFDYEADSDVSLFVYDLKNADIISIVGQNQRIASTLAVSAISTMFELNNWLRKSISIANQNYAGLKEEILDYEEQCYKLGQSPKEFPELKTIEKPCAEYVMQEWEYMYFSSLRDNAETLKGTFFSESPRCLGIIMQTISVSRAISFRMIEQSEYLATFTAKKSDFEMEYNFIKAKVNSAEQEGSEDELHTITGAMDLILGYSGMEAEKCKRFKEVVAEFGALKDKTDTGDTTRVLRRDITALFYELYELVFLKSVNDGHLSDEVKMFLMFGFVDENLAGEANTQQLYLLMRKWKPDHTERILNIYEWLKKIYYMEVNPSKNEFDQDYFEFLKEQARSGSLTQGQIESAKQSAKLRLKFEIQNMFTSCNRLTYGHITSFVPVFYAEEVIRPLDTCMCTPERVRAAEEAVEKIDYSCFAREQVVSFEKYEVNQFYVSRIVRPQYILLPNVGERCTFWQDIDGKRRDTPGRLMVPLFYVGSLEDAVIRMVGEFRWELCRRIQGMRWNDVTDPSLTSEYNDYLQFYRKNSELSADVKEKIKTALSSARNNYRAVFVSDYFNYIKFEAAGSVRLNKYVRNMLFKYCPFRADIRNELASNPQYGELIEKRKIKQAQKIKLVDNTIHKIRQKGGDVPEEVAYEMEYLKM